MAPSTVKRQAELLKNLGLTDNGDLIALLRLLRAVYAPIHNDYMATGGKDVAKSKPTMKVLKERLREAFPRMPAAVLAKHTGPTGILRDSLLIQDVCYLLWFVRLHDPSWSGQLSLDPAAYTPIIPMVTEDGAAAAAPAPPPVAPAPAPAPAPVPAPAPIPEAPEGARKRARTKTVRARADSTDSEEDAPEGARKRARADSTDSEEEAREVTRKARTKTVKARADSTDSEEESAEEGESSGDISMPDAGYDGAAESPSKGWLW